MVLHGHDELHHVPCARAGKICRPHEVESIFLRPGASVTPDSVILVLSNPAVEAYLQDTFTSIKSNGFQWAKVDFTYWDILGKPLYANTHGQSLTNIEAWRMGWRTIREALGPDVFLLGIGVMGANIGVLDGMRLTSDNGPKWDEADPELGVNAAHLRSSAAVITDCATSAILRFSFMAVLRSSA